jgi:hypothetical protein
MTACTPLPALRRATLPQLQMRAAFDLACSPQSLSLYNFDERNKGVFGCGQRLSYVESCDASIGQCTWMIDGFAPAALAAARSPAMHAPPSSPSPSAAAPTGTAAAPNPPAVVAPVASGQPVAAKPRPPLEPDLDIRD